jgi:putative oxidoreductase
LRVVIQRLFSSFPDSCPGAGLLLLRLAAGIPLVVSAIWAWPPVPNTGDTVFRLMELGCGTLVLIGLWTPVAAVMQALLQAAAAYTMHYDLMHLAAPLAGLSLALVGPGAWSIDARLYGRKRIRV